MARVQAALRGRGEPETFALGELSIDYGPRRVTLAGKPVPLTPLEFELLRVLSLNAGDVMATATLLRQVWRRREADRVRTAVRRLQRKLGDNASTPAYIFNEPGVGYRMPSPRDA